MNNIKTEVVESTDTRILAYQLVRQLNETELNQVAGAAGPRSPDSSWCTSEDGRATVQDF